MLGGTVLDRMSSINDLGVIMDEKTTFSEHVDVMVAKAFAMLGFISRLSLEFGDPYTQKSFYMEPVLRCSCWQSGMSAKAVYPICFAWFGLNKHAWFATIWRQMRPSAYWHPCNKAIDCLCDVYFRCSEWESLLTKLFVRSRFDHTAISDSQYRVSAYWFPSNELWTSWTNVGLRCDSLMRI
jgi:hypothetical protein